MTTQTETITTDDLRDQMLATLSVIEKFTRVLEQETLALRKSDFKTVDELQADKMNLARDYEQCVTTLAAARDQLMSADETLREKVIRARTQFTVTLTENLKMLDHVKECSKRLVNRILTAAREATEEKSAYGAAGVMETTRKNYAVSFDQSL